MPPPEQRRVMNKETAYFQIYAHNVCDRWKITAQETRIAEYIQLYRDDTLPGAIEFSNFKIVRSYNDESLSTIRREKAETIVRAREMSAES